MSRSRHLLALDYDKTLIPVRSIIFIAEHLGIRDKIEKILALNTSERKKSMLIARELSGVSVDKLKEISKDIPLRPWAKRLLSWASMNGFYIVVITLAYDLVVKSSLEGLPVNEFYAPKLSIDNHKITGLLQNSFTDIDATPWCIECGVCKRLIVKKLKTLLNIDKNRVIAVGDSLPDACMFKEAGLSIAINPSNPIVAEVSSYVLREDEDPLPLIASYVSRQSRVSNTPKV